MGNVLTIAGKDLRLLWRDKAGLFFVLLFPLIYALFFGAIFGGGGGGGARKIQVAIVDQDDSEASRAMVARLRASDAIEMKPMPLAAARESVRKGDLVALIQLEDGFGAGSMPFQPPAIAPRVVTDPSRQAERGVLQGVLMEAIFAPFQESFSDPAKMRESAAEVREQLQASEDTPVAVRLALGAMMAALDKLAESLEDGGSGDNDNNPFAGERVVFEDLKREQGKRAQSSYEITFPSSILWGILGCAAGFAITLVRERKSGTLQRLRLAPISRAEILAGKGLACFVSCAAVIVLLLGFAKLVFGIRILDPLHLALAITCTALCFVGIMMLVSVLGRSEEAVAGAGWAIFVVMAMVGGGMIPLFLLPEWLVPISHASPVKWGILSLEGAIWRDFTLVEMLHPCGVLLAIGAGCFLVARWRMPQLEE